MPRTSYSLDPVLLKDLTEAKAALARHGIVIIRGVETDLEPAIMAEVKESMASSPKRLAQLKEHELDGYAESMRKAAMESAHELKDLYIRLLAKLGTEFIGELAKELEGIDQLFKWGRISRSVQPVNAILESKGFRPIELTGPETLSDAFKVELDERWDAAFIRFKLLAEQAAEEIKRQEEEETKRVPVAESKRMRKKV
jgi:hypothetical protein